MLYVIAVILFKWILFLIHRPKILGKKENLKLKGGVIFIANHQNYLDPVMLVVAIPRMIHFMAKKELFEGRIKNAVFRSLLVFPVNRKTADIKALKQALALLEEGKAFGIFPEGRRCITGDIDDFEKGTAFIAAKCTAPIVPIYISPSSYKGTRRLVMNVGETITADEVKQRLLGRKLVDALTERMQTDMEKLCEETEAMLQQKKTRKEKRTGYA